MVGEGAPCEIEVAPSLLLSAPGSPALMPAAPGFSFESRPILTVPSAGEPVVAPTEEEREEEEQRWLFSCPSSLTWGFCYRPHTHRSPRRMHQFVRVIDGNRRGSGHWPKNRHVPNTAPCFAQVRPAEEFPFLPPPPTTTSHTCPARKIRAACCRKVSSTIRPTAAAAAAQQTGLRQPWGVPGPPSLLLRRPRALQ